MKYLTINIAVIIFTLALSMSLFAQEKSIKASKLEIDIDPVTKLSSQKALNAQTNAKIIQVMLWNNPTTMIKRPLFFRRSDNVWCYVREDEKRLYSMVLTLYNTGKLSTIHCYDQTTTLGGVVGHHVHRINTNPSP